MNKTAGLCAAAIVALGLVSRAAAQSAEAPPPDQPPPPDSPADAPPQVLPAPQPEAPLAPPPEAAPATSPAAPPAPAEAAPFGAKGQFAISIERAVGVDHISQTESTSGQDLQKATATNFSLFGPPAAGTFSVFSFPRAAFDWFLAPDLSVGLGLGLIRGSIDITPTGSTSSSDQSMTGLLVMPRAGYAWHLAPDVALWLRAGVSIVYLKIDTSNGSEFLAATGSAHYVAVTVEAPFVFTLLPHLAFTVGPTVDVTFDGRMKGPFVEDGTSTFDEQVTELGIQAGLLFDL